MWDDRTTRRPRLLLRLSGALSLRYDARALTWALFQDPPRTTRRAVAGSLTNRNWRARSVTHVPADGKKMRGARYARSMAANAASSEQRDQGRLGDEGTTRRP